MGVLLEIFRRMLFGVFDRWSLFKYILKLNVFVQFIKIFVIKPIFLHDMFFENIFVEKNKSECNLRKNKIERILCSRPSTKNKQRPFKKVNKKCTNKTIFIYYR